MHLLPFTDCCLHLGIDPKTLRLWLKAAQLSCCLHPHDARLKCLTSCQLQELAELHGRVLPPALLDPALPLPSPAPREQPHAHPPDDGVRSQLAELQRQVVVLQAQVSELALLLARLHLAQPTPTSPAPLACQLPTPLPLVPPPPPPEDTTSAATIPAKPRRKPSRALPLIQMRPDGSVVVIAPTQGVLTFLPDTPEWFAWLASLNAFSFEGLHGSFTASRKFRKGQRVQAWMSHRSLNGRSCSLYLGLTSALTLAHLQDSALAVVTRLTAR